MASQKAEKEFFKKENDTPHGLVKRILYKKYLQAYIPKTQYEKAAYSFKTVIIDGFAGAGRYGNEWPNEIEKYGSPLIALMVALGFCHKKYLQQKSTKRKADGKAKKEKIDTTIVWGSETSTKDPENELLDELQVSCMRTEGVGRTCEIHMYFVEKNGNNYKSLKSNIELLIIKFLKKYYPDHKYGFAEEEDHCKVVFDINTEPFSIRCEVIQGEFSTFEPPADLYDRNTRSLTFLDPFGYTHTPMDRVQLFAREPGNEVLINFMSSFVNRFVSRNPNGVIRLFGMEDLIEVASLFCIGSSDLKIDDQLVDFVKTVIHSCDPKNSSRARNNICKVTSNYERFLRRKICCNYLQSFEVVDKGNTTLYHLIHTTNHAKGLESMKEAMNPCSQKEGEMRMSDYDVLKKGHPLNFGNKDNQKHISEVLYKQFAGQL